ncbi:MAG: DUF4178 domain-containing protein [Verrucomicrobiota bacterium]
MSTANPTSLRIGARGTLHNWSVTVTGRLVLGVDIEGETYYWNEYILTGDSGNTGTLVIEEGEEGPEWKLFRMFEPARPMSAQEAATKKVGDTVNLNGQPIEVTLVDQSRVYHIEGAPPEGVELGDIAHYFNADTGRSMLVASWTGDEIEFFEGHDVPAALVESAFGIAPSAPTRRSMPASGSKRSILLVLVLFGIVVLIAFFLISALRPKAPPRTGAGRPASAQPVPARPIVRLPLAASGTLEQHHYTVVGAATVTLVQRSGKHDETEYLLRADNGESALLIRGLLGGTHVWHLFTPTLASTVSPELDPYAAAALRAGARINLTARSYQVANLLHAKAGTKEGGDVAAATWPAVQYGWIAQGHETGEAEDWLLARWTENGIQFHRGHSVPESEIVASLVAKVER